MLKRELVKGRGKSRHDWMIALDRHGCSIAHFATRRILARYVETKAQFDRELQEKLDQGFTETERSLSRRVFVKALKFWIIALDGASVLLQFGSQRVVWSDRDGQKQTKDFPSAEEALTAYHDMIAKKKREGYREKHKRLTSYSKPPKTAAGQTAKKPAAGKKP